MRITIVVGAEGQLARRAAERIDDEDMIEAGLDVAGAVGAVGHLVDHFERFGPFRALGLGRRRAELGAVVGDIQEVSDAGAVGRPFDRLRAIGQAGDPVFISRQDHAYIPFQ